MTVYADYPVTHYLIVKTAPRVSILTKRAVIFPQMRSDVTYVRATDAQRGSVLQKWRS